MAPSRITAAPTGTSPAAAARRPSSRAAAMPARSTGPSGGDAFGAVPVPCPARLGTHRFASRAGWYALEREMLAVLGPAHPHQIPFGVLPFEDREGERVLHQPLDGTLQGP